MPTAAPPAHLNGIDLEALRRTVDAIRADPRLGKAVFRAETRWIGKLASESKFERWTLGGQDLPIDFTVRIDEPDELMGQGRSPNPQMILMAAANSCMLNTYVAAATVMGVKLDELAVESEGELDLRGFLGIDPAVPSGYGEIRVTFRVRGDGTPEQFEKMLELVRRQSPNYDNLTHEIRVDAQVQVA